MLSVSHGTVSVWVRDVSREAAEPDSGLEMKEDELPPEDEPIRRCGRCKRSLPESAFNRHREGRQWWCRDCFREYFRRRGDMHRRQSRAAKQKRQQAARAFVQRFLAEHACTDCGEPDPIVLEFDHVGKKRKEVSLLAAGGASLKLLRAEIEQCQVVCVNCHRRRTGRRDNWRRAQEHWWKAPPPLGAERARNVAFAYSHLERSSCLDCGCHDLCVLDFDHVGSKTSNVLKLARDGVGLERLALEISHCEVRCANCHRRRTVQQRRKTHG